MRKQAEMSIEQLENGQYIEHIAYPYVEYDHVTFENGMQIEKVLEDDVAMSTVTHDTSSFKVGQGESDVSESIVDSSIASMTIKGQTYQNILPSPTLRNSMTDGNTMQKINEGYDSVEVVDGNVKSAILKGCTLVNLCEGYTNHANAFSEMWYGVDYRSYMSSKIKSNTTYTVIVENLGNRFSIAQSNEYIKNDKFSLNGNLIPREENPSPKNRILKVQTLDDAQYMFITTFNDGSNTDTKVMILEGDYTNVDIPYFEGMQSVKMPVLTTTGKNLWNDNWSKGLTSSSGVVQTGGTYDGFRYNEDLISTKPLSTLYFKSFAPLNGMVEGARVAEFGVNKEFLKMNLGGKSFTLSENTYFIRVHFDLRYNNGVSSQAIPSDDVLTFGMVSTSPFTDYEPYKSNILTVNEDVTLRGIGDVRDTLDCLTGEVTERIGEMILDGSEDWKQYVNGVFTLALGDKLAVNKVVNINCICDKLKASTYSQTVLYGKDRTENLICVNSDVIGICLKELETTTELTHLREFLSQNPIAVQYELAEPTIKTVDLSILDQDNQPVEQLQSYANGYIQLSSNVAEGEYSLTPSIEYEVPTSNSYYVDLAKPSTQYTMKNMQGTFTLDDIQYTASANGTFTTPSTLTNKFMVTSVAQSQPMLLEGDMTSEEVPYVEGIKSAFEGVDKVEIVSQNADNTLSNTTSFPITNPLRSLPNGVRDEIVLDRMSNKAKLIQRVGEDLTQLRSPIVTQVDIEGFPYVYKDGHIFLNTEVAPMTEVKYSINQSQIIESQSEDIVRHSKEIDNLYNLIATYVQVNYDSTLLNLKTKGV